MCPSTPYSPTGSNRCLHASWLVEFLLFCTFIIISASVCYVASADVHALCHSDQVWQGNTMLYEKVFGHQHRESNTPVTRESQFRIGSNSKTFTTMAILQFGNTMTSCM